MRGVIIRVSAVECVECGRIENSDFADLDRAREDFVELGWKFLHGAWHCCYCAADHHAADEKGG